MRFFFKIKEEPGLVWWLMPINPVFGMLRQEDYREFKARLQSETLSQNTKTENKINQQPPRRIVQPERKYNQKKREKALT